MGRYYEFYNPKDMSLIREGKIVGMPFAYNCLQDKIKEVPTILDNGYDDGYNYVGVIGRHMAEEFQKVMDCNKTFFTDLMDEYGVDSLIYISS